jgi:Mce-associated membrane protein
VIVGSSGVGVSEEPPAGPPAARRPRPYRIPAESTTPEPQAAAPEEVPVAAPSRSRAILVSVVVLAACVAFFIAGLIVYLTAGGSSADRAAQVRDEVLLDARQDVVVLNTLDYRSVDQGLKRWSAASTGTLHDSLTRVGAATRQHIVSARKITTAKVLDAAVVALNQDAGSATVIAAVQLRVASPGGSATIKRERLRAEMARVDGTWKVSSLEQVGVTVG